MPTSVKPKTLSKSQTSASTAKDHKNAEVCVFCGQHKHLSSIEHTVQDTPALDRLLHASMSKVFGLSPAALATVCFDWLAHLAIAPGKQAELVQSAIEKTTQLTDYLMCTFTHSSSPIKCAQPMPNDRRFIGDDWQDWPYNMYQQAFLLTEQWWQEATSGVRGVTRHHTDVMSFLTRQWLDMFAPLNFAMTNPRVAQATVEQHGMNFIKGAKNFYDDLTQLLSSAPPVGTENYQVGKQVAITKGKVVYQNRLIELIQYAPVTKEVYPEPILIVPAWIMKYYILDLSPENSLVKYLVENGHTVFMISWKNPDADDRDLGFEDYLHQGVMAALDAINAILPKQKVHAAGYCLGGTLLSIAAAAMARDNNEQLQSITLLAAQVDFEEAGELLLFVDESQLAYLEDVMWEQGYLDKQQMAGTFQMLRSFDLIWSRILEQYLLGHRGPINDLMAWNTDATRMPYRMHTEYLRSLYLNNDLAEGHFIADGSPVELADIRLPIFAVGTQRDHVAPWQSVYKILLFTESREVTFVLTSGGHNAGIVSEPGHPHRTYQIGVHKENDRHLPPDEWREHTPLQEGSWWPAWQQWLANQSGKKVDAPPFMGASTKGYTPLRDAPGQYVLIQ